ncbi:glycerol-3-phosphate 1-O-acyltransferase PlsY [Parasporobacterium paucivorans]|uniref:Glycerol-3-phosphate acyltransferase n=1 Tax=Parasporobacterium paucivorans DSM 15970 TaxID=1122934 RepID=A0A1M6A0X3_9FIRM|nr:glycerol-3-phosphate 1-O-acyltransferase PlsY [Parasporobacterium paucivorans]SHI29989.1 acyl-phosphate glycerol-3-phosphate acyltransferase [Parasporobacterium paucivorans DSM 15970]
MERIICLVIGYVFGLFQTGYIYGRIKHVDIRTSGSGNAGTTNALRVLGKKAGIITFIGDVIKAVVAGLLTRLVFHGSDIDITVLLLYTGIGVVLGHNFPFYLNFKGGKGIAATGGIVISLLDWRLILIGLVTFIVVIAVTKYVSLGSLSLVTGFVIEFILFVQMKWYSLGNAFKIEAYLLVLVIAALAYFQHRGNIVRLINKSENKFGQKKEGL